MLGNVLVPVDGSELSERILAQVRRLLLRKESEVVLLRVIETRLDEPSVERAREYLEGLAKKLARDGVKVSTRLVAGEPSARILEEAADTKPGLIAMATHGRTGAKRWIRGSVAERVLRAARAPVLAANPFALERDSASEMSFRRIVVPLDGSDESASILPIVHDLARVYESEVDLVHVLELRAELSIADPLVAFSLESRAEATAMLEHFRKKLGGVSARSVVVTGAAAAAILDLAEQERADLIALTTHGRSGASRWVYGSVAEHVVNHARCPLLVLRTGGEPAAQEGGR